ncbi:hypothetical protein COX68_03230 [Candidatus Falkowbacteria bacterium CG_4_10_14_0_2_um_filter_41_15]|uniref:Uncharacterized protein n=4 Tax=Candidatus Falkowiibacteriota TaxID=1752728 RepID=A0A2G9ZP58_9BACT|nr:MAG: hypothetical protein AUJ35_00790 [Candidatus Falkowbacteria bacterium CG1_02_41_21]PIP34360.1 MAG: hypothetical protein COX21_03380 [Candidatus Falkowbacteria bacterium CG23_combo_of_CG06-09_8_20_14_all_41_10]PIZ09675.1 MAG: hypothetical protein COY54_02515 [Candidatus Falkowbacteria bacterium CG_4_10_14_0_8_um_filter_41_36]PJA09181.1 MAG: hypothetical protein COX68_03230 [Candidatus Falkowbacteria bacterium CG_4_10_14_0_2_um_filter_41_15]
MKPGQIIVLTNLSLWLLLEAFVFWPKFFYIILLLLNIVLILAIRFLLHKANLGNRLWNLWILPFLVLNSIVAYAILIPQDIWLNKFFIQILFILIIGFNFSYFKNIYNSIFHPDQPNNLPGLSTNFSFLSWFFLLAAVYGLQLFLDLSYWILILILIVLALLTTYQYLWINNLKGKESYTFVFLLAFVIAQLAWSVYFLPFDYNSLGLIMALIYYVFLNLTRLYLNHNWNKRNLQSLLVFSGVIMLLILLTLKWR